MNRSWLKFQLALLSVAIPALLLLCAQVAFARIPIPEGTEDLQSLGTAPFIFHATIVSFDTTANEWSEEGFAILRVDRWYKGKVQGSAVRLRFTFSKIGFLDGHDCVDLHRSDSWLIFAKQESGDIFDFYHDCEGGLPMSPTLAAKPHGAWDQQLQQDVIAGLHDPDPAMRLANISRLGGLKLASSAAALQDFINTGSEEEKKWAIYAALRSGDLSVLPQVESIVINIERRQLHGSMAPVKLDAAPHPGSAYGDPDADIAIELQRSRDRAVVPSLIRIMQSAKTEFVRYCAWSALEEISDPRSAPAAAEALNDSSPSTRFAAIVLLWNLTKEPSCEIPNGSLPESESAPYYQRCKAWWDTTGSSIAWPAVK